MQGKLLNTKGGPKGGGSSKGAAPKDTTAKDQIEEGEVTPGNKSKITQDKLVDHPGQAGIGNCEGRVQDS